jgi:hypothetical protein
MECFGTIDFDNSWLITLSAITISGLHCILCNICHTVMDNMSNLRTMLFSDLYMIAGCFFRMLGTIKPWCGVIYQKKWDLKSHHCGNLSTSIGHVLAILMGHPDVLHITTNMQRKFISNVKHKIMFIFHIKHKPLVSTPWNKKKMLMANRYAQNMLSLTV